MVSRFPKDVDTTNSQGAQTTRFVWLMVQVCMKAELKYASMEHGAQFVMMSGTYVMQMSFADSCE